VTFFVLYVQYWSTGAVMQWCFDCTNKCHSNYFICASDRSYGLDWIWVSI